MLGKSSHQIRLTHPSSVVTLWIPPVHRFRGTPQMQQHNAKRDEKQGRTNQPKNLRRHPPVFVATSTSTDAGRRINAQLHILWATLNSRTRYLRPLNGPLHVDDIALTFGASDLFGLAQSNASLRCQRFSFVGKAIPIGARSKTSNIFEAWSRALPDKK